MAPSKTWEFPSYTQTAHRSVYPSIDPTNKANSATGKVVVVTGGGLGVGKGIAKAFVTAGAKAVVILGRRENVLAEAKKDLESAGSSKILTFKADVVDEKALNEAFASTAEQVGPIDVVVANAGYLTKPGPIATADVDDYFKGFEVQVKGTLLTFRAFLAHKSSQGEPTFIAINTGGAHGPFYPGISGYSSSKIAQAHLTSYLQAEHPEMRVVSMHPGTIETEMYEKSGMGGMLTTDDISLPSGFAVWLSSPAANWTKGRFLWAHWDVDELTKLKDQIIEKDHLRMVLNGWPAVEKPDVV